MADLNMYKGSGTEPLGSDPTTKSNAGKDSPSGGGKDAGGTANLGANWQVKAAGAKESPKGGTKHWPSGVRSFEDGRV